MRGLIPKSENRNPKEGRKPKSERKARPRLQCSPALAWPCLDPVDSDLGLRPSFGFRISGFGLLLAAGLFWWPPPLLAATNLISADDIPPLRPARAELPPGFWEQYGVWVIVAGIAVGMVAAGMLWILTRPKPPMAVAPATQARRALEPLQGRPEDGLVLSRVSQILRHYVTAAFGLPTGELTTAEFCRDLIHLDQMGPTISVPLTNFLRQCDQRKFAPNPHWPESLGAVEQALNFIARCEARLDELRRAAVSSGETTRAHNPLPRAQIAGGSRP